MDTSRIGAFAEAMIGAFAEAMIAAEAIRLGFNVLRPVCDVLRYDLAFEIGVHGGRGHGASDLMGADI